MDSKTYRELPDQLVPIGVAATMLGVSVDTVRRWADDGAILSQRTAGGQRRFTLAEVDRVKNGEPLTPEGEQ